MTKLLEGYENIEIIKLLNWMLEFNPYYRCSASEAIRAKVFDQVRKPKNEKTHATTKTFLEIDSDDAFDYSKGISTKYSKDMYHALIVKEQCEIQKSYNYS